MLQGISSRVLSSIVLALKLKRFPKNFFFKVSTIQHRLDCALFNLQAPY